MKTKIITGIALATLATAGTLTYAASTTGTGNVLGNTFSRMHLTGSGGFDNTRHNNKKDKAMEWFRMDKQMQWFGMGGPGITPQLTDEGKTKLASMTTEQKKAFFQTKMIEQKALRDAKEAVIDKLINGETLSDAEKTTLETIKTERAAMKAERAAREAKITEIKPIFEKVKAGTALTTDEQAKLDAFKTTMKEEEKGGKMRGMGR